ncbi:uncharacterized mitochondrial protein-like protein [Tanacetum coccineum]
MSMNYQPVFVGNQTNGNAGTKVNINAGQAEKKTVSGPQYVLLPFMTFDSQGPKSSEDEVTNDAGKKNGVLDPAKEGDKNGQEKDVRDQEEALRKQFEQESERLFGQGKATNFKSTNRLNTVSSSVNVVSSSFTTVDPGREKAQRNEFESVFGQDKDANSNNTYRMFTPLEDTVDLQVTGIFSSAYDDEDVGDEADLNNLETTMNVSPIPITRIYKDHPKEQIIGDLNLATQTRKMINFSKELGMVSYINKQRRTNHKDYQNCLFACFLSQQKPKKVIQALTDPSWIEAMQVGLLCRFNFNRAWYETLSTYLLENGFRRGTIDKTLFIKKAIGDILLVQVYVDDIIFGSTKKSLCTDFEGLMHKKFQMSSMGELTFFLGLQVMQRDDGIFISQDKYVVDILKKFDFSLVKKASTPIETNKALLKDKEAEDVDVHLYRSMIGLLMYLTASRPDIMFAVCACARLISWQCKKQTIVANSTTEAEYVAAANCCGQFWATAKSKIVNDEKQIHATVDDKTVDTEIPQSSGPPKKVGDEAVYTGEDDRVVRAATTPSSLESEQESGNIHKTRPTETLNEPSPQGTGSGSGPRCQDTTLGGGGADAQARPETASKKPHDSPLSGGHTPGSDEGRLDFSELINICTQLSNRVLALEQSKTAQDLVIIKLQKKVKRLEKALRARTLGMKLFKIGTSRKKSLDKENVSKRVFNDITAKMDVNTAEPVNAAGDIVNATSVIPDVSADCPSTSIAGDIFEDEMTTIADTLIAIRSTRPRTTSAVIRNVEEEPRRATPVPTVQSQDKGKDKMVEPGPTLKNLIKAQIQRDAEIAQRAVEQEAKDAALIEQIEDVQARMDADVLLAERLQQEEKEQFTVDEQASMLVDLIVERKRFLACTKRLKIEIRNKPPTKAQLRNKMVTFLKHMDKYTHNQLKSKSFKEIQKLYEREQKWINDFVPMNDDSEKKDDDSKQQARSSKKRPRADPDEESAKKQKLEEDDAEKEKLRAYLDIVPGDDIAMDFESLATKYPITDWKTHILTENMMYYQIIRADGSSKNYKIFNGILDDFDRQDVIDLYRLVKESSLGYSVSTTRNLVILLRNAGSQKGLKTLVYHKEKMLLCKQAKKGVPLQVEQFDWLADMDEEINEQELEAHYSYMAKIQEVPIADSGTDSEPLEQVQYDTRYNVFANEIQHSEQPESIINTCVVETGDSNVIPDSLDMCDNDIQNDQNGCR